MCKNSSAPSINVALWHYLGTYNLDFRRENNSTPGVLIEEIRYSLAQILWSNFIGNAGRPALMGARVLSCWVCVSVPDPRAKSNACFTMSL